MTTDESYEQMIAQLAHQEQQVAVQLPAAWGQRLDAIEAKVDMILALLRTDGEAVPELETRFAAIDAQIDAQRNELLGLLGTDGEAAPQSWHDPDLAGLRRRMKAEYECKPDWRKPINDPNGGRS